MSDQRWRDRQGDIWSLGDDGLMHTPETEPFPREHVEKKWGPLLLCQPIGAPPTGDNDDLLTEAIAAVARVRELLTGDYEPCFTDCTHLECDTARAVLKALDGAH